MLKCRILSREEIYRMTEKNAEKIKRSGFKPEVIVGVARGGWVHARILCDFLRVKELYSIKVSHWGITASRDQEGARLEQGLGISLKGKKVLVVDDITDTGQSLELAKSHVLSKEPEELKTATLMHIRGAGYIPDFFAEEVEWAWMIFPWNYWEDIENLIEKMLNREMSIGEIAEYFYREHGIDVPLSHIKRALENLIERRIVEKRGKEKEVFACRK